jgi:nitrous oxidase accessory protein NosD
MFELNVTDGQIYTKSEPGNIKGIHLKNIQWAVDTTMVLFGYDENHLVEDVTFEGCTVGGEPFPGLEYSQLKMNSFVKNVKVIN